MLRSLQLSLVLHNLTLFCASINAAIANAYKERDWNKEFQSIMAESQFLFSDAGDISAVDDWDKYGALSHLARDFIYASKLYAKVIISELYVPTEHKTIKPVKIGGIAGGAQQILVPPARYSNQSIQGISIFVEVFCSSLLSTREGCMEAMSML